MKINTKRLELLAYYLDSVPFSQFGMTSWTRCAIGWATQVPEFAKLGFKLTNGIGIPVMPVYRSFQNWQAVEKFFGLEVKEAEYLFSMFAYEQAGTTNAQRVACRIRKFIEGTKGI